MKRYLLFSIFITSSVFAEYDSSDKENISAIRTFTSQIKNNGDLLLGDFTTANSYLNSIKLFCDLVDAPIVNSEHYLQLIDSQVSSLKSFVDEINSKMYSVTTIKDTLAAVNLKLGDINSNVDSIESILSGSMSSIKSDVDSIETDVGRIETHIGNIDSSIGSSLGSDVTSIMSTLSSIDSTLSGMSFSTDGLSTESTLSSFKSFVESDLGSIYDSLGDNVGSDLSIISDYFSDSTKIYDDSQWKIFRDLFTGWSKTLPTASSKMHYFSGGKTRYTTYTRTSLKNIGDWFRFFPDYLESNLSILISGQTYFFQDAYTLMTDIKSNISKLDSIDSHLGNIEVASDLTTIVEFLSTISGDVQSILGKIDDDDDDSEDPWKEFRDNYVSLFDNQSIPTYEIDYALIGWETNSVATKQTLTQSSGSFFDLCLAFVKDGNTIAASETMFLHHILDYLPNLKPPEKVDTTEDENRIDRTVSDVSGQFSTLEHTFKFEDLAFKEDSIDFFDSDTITGQFDGDSLPANITIIIPPIFNFETQAFNISTAGFADFFDYTRAFCAVLYYVLLCGFILFVFRVFLVCSSKFAKVVGFTLQW